MSDQPLVICEYCDTVHRHTEIVPGATARCQNCRGPLYRKSRFNLDAILALTVASGIMFVVANAWPIVEMESQGVTRRTTLLGMVVAAWDSDISLVAAIAALTIFFFPLMQLILYAYVLPGLRRGRPPREFSGAMRLLKQLRPWAMVEVFLIGVLVSIVKMGDLADVRPQPGIFAFGALTLFLTALGSFDLHELWSKKPPEEGLAEQKA